MTFKKKSGQVIDLINVNMKYKGSEITWLINTYYEAGKFAFNLFLRNNN